MANEGDDYASLKAKHLHESTLFTDSAFPPGHSSLADRAHPGPVPPGIKWRRAKDINENAKFTSGHATRFDLDQGNLGDCWFVSAASVLAVSNRKLFERCVPQDQSFQDGYAGIFRFNFWRFGRWVEVVVDDYLPTVNGQLCYCRNRDDPTEFWSALLEKAYAKLHGSYRAIDGGHISDALVDFTGGISEIIPLKPVANLPDNFFTILNRTNKMNSMMGVSISAKTREQNLPNGLYTGHAYSITDVKQVTVNEIQVDLLRLRNPWGRGEWNGAWSDGSREWRGLSDADRGNFGIVVRDDGEFWMTYEDMLECFTHLKMCHLSPDAITAEAAQDGNIRSWNVGTYHGEWIRGFNAGGAGQPPSEASLWKNSQYHLGLTRADDDDKDGKCTVVVSLMQKDEQLTSDLYIGFILFKLKQGRRVLMDNQNYDRFSLVRKAYSPYSNSREIATHLSLDPGTYVIMPTTYDFGKEGEYLLRIFSEKAAESEELDIPTQPRRPNAENREELRKLFKKFSGGDRHMDAKEFKRFLNNYFKDKMDTQFGKGTARSLISIVDTNENGTIEFKEFRKLVKDLDVWQLAFVKFDKDSSGYIDTMELGELFKAIGFSVSRRLMKRFARRYGGKDRQLDFDDFIVCIAVVYDVYEKARRSDGIEMERAMEDRLEQE